MSEMRHTEFYDYIQDKGCPISTFVRDYPGGHVVALHFHNRDQLVYSSRGVMTVRTRDATWVVPTHRGVWIPAMIGHSITMSGNVAMRTLYLRPRLAKALPRGCCVVNVSPLLRELLLQACAFRRLNATSKQQQHLIAVMLDQFEVAPIVPLQLPNLADTRALQVAKLLYAAPGDRRPLWQLCKVGGVGKRTIQRIFPETSGMTFGKWRQQLRLMHAMRLLAEGSNVTYAAMEAGYSTPSAFISAFRKVLGTTPTSYFRSPAQHR